MKKHSKHKKLTRYPRNLLHEETQPSQNQPAAKKPPIELQSNKGTGREHARRLDSTSHTQPAPVLKRREYDLAALQTMKALSIRQPYAGLIMAGIKNVENRSWFTSYRGPLAIVSTKSPDAKQWWGPMRDRCRRLGVAFPEDLCRVNASVLGSVDFRYLVYIDERGHEVTDHPTLTFDQVATWWNSDDEMVGFVFEHPIVLKTPIPISGRLGLYNLAPAVITEIAEQLK